MTPDRGPTRRPETDQPPAGARQDDGEDGQLGLFRSWRALYITVIVYTIALTILLFVFTRLLDFSG